MRFLMNHKILIISLGNVPYDANQIVEGGGLRCWGLAKALSESGYLVKLCIPDSYLIEALKISTNLVVVPYESATDLIQELIDSTVVIYPAGAPHLSNLCIENSSPSTILVADAYVPIHVEVASRQFQTQIANEEVNYRSLSAYWLRAITDAQIIICASEEQQAYYLGILAATGRLSPVTYHQVVIVVIPFGFFPESEIKVEGDVKIQSSQNTKLNILWYGGFYPWFDTSSFANLLSNLDSKLVEEPNVDYQVRVVGALNPFIIDKNFVSHANEQIRILKNNSKVTFLPWLPFEKRKQSFYEIDVVICLTSDGYENQLAWRTRYLDFIEFSVPLLTNSNDPLAKKIIETEAGWYFDSNNPQLMQNKLLEILREPAQHLAAKQNYTKLKTLFTWDQAIKPLAEILQNDSSKLLEDKVKNQNQPTVRQIDPLRKPSIFRLFLFGLSQLRSEGISATFNRSRRYISSRRNSSKNPKLLDSPRALLFLHQLDYSGSPLVATELAINLANRLQEFNLAKILIFSFGKIDSRLAESLIEKGIAVIPIEGTHVPRIVKTDLVIINGLAHNENFFLKIIEQSQSMVRAPIILVHEDRPLVHLEQRTLNKIGHALNMGRIRIISPSLGTTRNLQKSLKSNLIETKPYSINQYPICEKNFEEVLNIHLTGSTHDFRKNQHFALILVSLIEQQIKIRQSQFRKIHLTLIGVNQDTAYGKSIHNLASSMKNYVSIYPPKTKEETIEIIKRCNTVLCISEYEALPLFVSESMTMGHIVLRNNCSGVDEQLLDGQNGLLLDLSNLHEASEKILTLLDKHKTSNAQLEEMSNESKRLVAPMLVADSLDFLGNSD